MMAAISAASSGSKVTLLEKNDALARKLLLTGGGRCNLTNSCRPEEFLDNFSKTGSFLRDALKSFGQQELISFFSERGLEVKIEDNGRVFPVTDSALSVLEILRKELDRLKVKILFKKSVKEVIVSNGKVRGVSCWDGSVINSERIVIATGGLSYRATGSTGDGLLIAEKMGHRIVETRPGLVSLQLEGTSPKKLEGLSLDDAVLTFRAGKSKIRSPKGSLIFTSSGISGPAVFSSSDRVVDWMQEGRRVSVEINIVPSCSDKEVDTVLSKEVSNSPGKEMKNLLKELVPARLSEVFLKEAHILSDKKAKDLKEKERKCLASLFKALRFNVSGSGSFEKAQITRGGVSVRDIDPKTMQSKKVEGLYFSGEIIDIDGNCGGFNLQAAFSSGYLAGQSAVGG